MKAGTPSRWSRLLVGAVTLGAAAAGLSQAQPTVQVPPPPGAQQAGPPPGSIDEVLDPTAPLPEEAPPTSVIRGAAPPPGASTVVEDRAKETPAETTPLPEKAPEPPKRARRSEAIIQMLDKVTAETVRFPAGVNKPVRWKDLVFTVRACEEPAPDDTDKGAFAHLEVYSEPRVSPGRAKPAPRLVYRGWMYAESPAVHPFEHPVYDVWLIACRTV